MPLTDAACKNAKCPEGRAYQRHTDSGGLYLEVPRPACQHRDDRYRLLPILKDKVKARPDR